MLCLINLSRLGKVFLLNFETNPEDLILFCLIPSLSASNVGQTNYNSHTLDGERGT